MGGFHTAKPVMAMDKGRMYNMVNGRPETKAIYEIRNNKAFATAHHPDGVNPHAVFEIRGDKIHTTEHHPNHNPNSHTFEIRSSM